MAGAGKIGRLFNQYGDDWQKVWHGSGEKIKGPLDSAKAGEDTPLGGEGTYFSPHRSVSEGYRHDYSYESELGGAPLDEGMDIGRIKHGSMIRAEIPGRDNFMPYQTSLKDMGPEELSTMREMFDEWSDIYQMDHEFPTTWDEWIEGGSLGEFIEEIGDPWGNQGFGKGAAGYVSENISGTGQPYEYVVKDTRNIRELGRNAVPLTVGGGAMAASQESEAMPNRMEPFEGEINAEPFLRSRLQNFDGEIQDRRPPVADQDVATLDRIRREPPGIYGPEHPRILAGLDAVRSIPGADFVGGGVLDLASEYAWGRPPSTEQKVIAGLEVGGGAALGMAGRLASRASRALPFGKKSDEFITDADYPSVIEPEDLDESFVEQFGSRQRDFMDPKDTSDDEVWAEIEKMARVERVEANDRMSPAGKAKYLDSFDVEKEAQRMADEPYEIDDISPYPGTLPAKAEMSPMQQEVHRESWIGAQPKDEFGEVINPTPVEIGRMKQSYYEIRDSSFNFKTEHEAAAARRAKDNPASWYVAPGRSGFELRQTKPFKQNDK